MKYKSLDKALADIHALKYQGATAVARATLDAYREFGVALTVRRPENWRREMKAAAVYLTRHNRPTEPLARNGLRFVWQRLLDQPTPFTLRTAVDEFLHLIDQTQSDISILGRLIIRKHANVMTHCHSTTVERLLIKTYPVKKFHIYSTETRPAYQGRITAQRLRRQRLPVTQVVDSAAPFLISHLSGKDVEIDTVIVGADVLLPNGSVVNKIGSYGIALAAMAQRVPVYVATTLLKYSRAPQVDIERRPMKEIWPQAPVGLDILNLAFDIIPAGLITGIVCEFGVIEPAAMAQAIRRNYPWLVRA